MRENTFRSRTVESSFLLPFMSVVVFLLWAKGPMQDYASWLTLACIAALTYTIVEWNNQCQLLRIRSRMNSATFLAFLCLFPTLPTLGITLLPAFALLACYFIMFKAYGAYHPQGYVYHAFLMLGIGCVAFPPLILLYPTLIFSSQQQLRILTFKSFIASILGLATPLWIYGAALVVASLLWGTTDTRLSHLASQMPDYAALLPWQWSVIALCAIVGLLSVGHFIATSYNDKIRTRQYFYTMLLQLLPVSLCAAWFTHEADFTLPLLTISVTPFAAHYYALARGRNMNLWFILTAIIFAIITLINHLDAWTLLVSQDFNWTSWVATII